MGIEIPLDNRIDHRLDGNMHQARNSKEMQHVGKKLAFFSTSRCSKGLWVRSGGKPSFTLKHPNRRNQVGQTGGNFHHDNICRRNSVQTMSPTNRGCISLFMPQRTSINILDLYFSLHPMRPISD